MSAGVVVETARVYRANGRRYFTKRAACRSLARAAIRARCECEPPSDADRYPGFVCGYHADHEWYACLLNRLARFIELRSRRAVSSSTPGPDK